MSEFNDENPDPGPVRRQRDVDRSDAAMGWWWLWACFFTLFLFAGLGWWGWGINPANNTAGTATSRATQAAAPVNVLLKKAGQSVTLHGNAVATAGAHAFVLHNFGNDDIGGKDILVISKQPISVAVATDATKTSVAKNDTDEKPNSADVSAEQPINVSMGDNAMYKVDGKVRVFNRDELQKETGVDLKDIDAKMYQNTIVVVADSLNQTQPAR